MRSTHSIVQGRRWRRKQFETEQPDTDDLPAAEGMPPAETVPVVAGRPRARWPWLLLAAVLLFGAGSMLGLLLRPQESATEPSEDTGYISGAEGMSIVTLNQEGLDTVIASGDLVAICTRGGVVPALQYVRVYLVNVSGISVYMSDVQLQAYMALPVSGQTVVLRCRHDDAGAEEYLAWQAAFNAPTVSLSFSQAEMTLNVGQTAAAPVRLTVTPAEATPEGLKWSSADPKIVTVDSDGTLTAVSEGETEITVEALEKTAVLQVRVLVPAEEVQLSQQTLSLPVGGTAALTASVLPENTTDATIQWSSGDTAVATVNVDGTVTALQAGTAVITAACGEVTAQCQLTVYTPAAGLSLSKTSLGLKVGDTAHLTAAITPDEAASRPIQWKSSDTSIATVSEDGTVKAARAGKVTITAACDSITATCTVTVSQEE